MSKFLDSVLVPAALFAFIAGACLISYQYGKDSAREQIMNSLGEAAKKLAAWGCTCPVEGTK